MYNADVKILTKLIELPTRKEKQNQNQACSTAFTEVIAKLYKACGLFSASLKTSACNNIDNSHYNVPKWSIPILDDNFGKYKMCIIAAYIYHNNFISQNEN